MIRRLLLALAVAGAAGLPALPRAAEPGPEAMAAHRAAYRLTLDHVREGSDIASARGAMLYEVVDACDGWATRQRLTLVLTNRDGQEVETASDYSTYETKDGHSIRFSLTQTSQGAVSQRVAGEAEVTPEGGRVRYTEPATKEVALPRGTLLPMMHTIRALDTAREGRRMMVLPLFDGTNPDGAQDTTTIILGGWQAPQPNARFPALSTLGSARMRIAFFDRKESGDGGATTPDYEVGLRYFANGVADDLNMDFGEFVVNGAMEELTLPPHAC